MKATIKIGKATVNHAVTLATLGYEFNTTDTHINVEHNGFVDTLVWNKENIATLVQERKMLSYSTKVQFSDGKTLHSVPAATKMGALSCLMAKGPAKAKKEDVSLEDLLTELELTK